MEQHGKDKIVCSVCLAGYEDGEDTIILNCTPIFYVQLVQFAGLLFPTSNSTGDSRAGLELRNLYRMLVVVDDLKKTKQKKLCKLM